MGTQPIIRGIQAVGSVKITYTYEGPSHALLIPSSIILPGTPSPTQITAENLEVAGFRLDSQFLDANPQIASSFTIPILGGGAISLTNNNRSGTLNVAATRVSTPDATGKMMESGDIGPTAGSKVYDLTLLAQIQQAQPGGDSCGATIKVSFAFGGFYTKLEFQGCTIASVKPVSLSGNDAVDYAIAINYLNWTATYSASSAS